MAWTLTPDKFLTPQETKRLRDHLIKDAQSGKPRAILRWMVIDLGLTSGLRCAELCDLQVESCYLSEEPYLIHVVKGKGGKSGNVFINRDLRNHMLQYLNGHSTGPFLLPERGGAYSRGGLQSLVKRIFAGAELPKRLSIHSLRHTFCSTLYKKTKDLRLVQTQARHSSPLTTAVYANLFSEDMKTGMEGLYD